MNNKGKYYITTAIAYTSGKPHIGNSYEIVLADCIARFKRKDGYDVYFQTGTDEHGQKIELKAQEAGVTPKEYVDNVAGVIRGLWDLMNTSYDHFIRTTDDYHEKQVQKIFKKLYDQGDIYKGSYEGLYCTPCESFWTELQLKDGCCPDCGRPVEKTREESYFFRLQKYAEWLIQYIEEHPDFIQPASRANEMLNNFLRPGLEDLCVSRTSIKWGIPVTFDEKHTVYVWIDALSNYISALGYGTDNDALFQKYWPADVHLVGKEIVRFHTIIWPIMLHALGLPLPKQVFGHGWLVINGKKMGKSYNNFITLEDFFAGNHPLLSQPFAPMVIRFFILQAHYRSTVDFSNDALIGAEKALRKMLEGYRRLQALMPAEKSTVDVPDYMRLCSEAMDDDLNTPQVIAHLFDACRIINAATDGNETLSGDDLQALRVTFKTFLEDILGIRVAAESGDGSDAKAYAGAVDLLLQVRANAKAAKDWATSDLIRDKLAELGFKVKDTRNGAEWSLE